MSRGRVLLGLLLLALAACAAEARRSRGLKASNRRTDFDFFFLVRSARPEAPSGMQRADLCTFVLVGWGGTDSSTCLLSGSGPPHSATTITAHTAHPRSKSVWASQCAVLGIAASYRNQMPGFDRAPSLCWPNEAATSASIAACILPKTPPLPAHPTHPYQTPCPGLHPCLHPLPCAAGMSSPCTACGRSGGTARGPSSVTPPATWTLISWTT